MRGKPEISELGCESATDWACIHLDVSPHHWLCIAWYQLGNTQQRGYLLAPCSWESSQHLISPNWETWPKGIRRLRVCGQLRHAGDCSIIPPLTPSFYLYQQLGKAGCCTGTAQGLCCWRKVWEGWKGWVEEGDWNGWLNNTVMCRAAAGQWKTCSLGTILPIQAMTCSLIHFSLSFSSPKANI